MKKCIKCGIEKDESEFYKTKGRPEGKCKFCRDIQIRKWKKENKERVIELNKLHYVKTKYNKNNMNVSIEKCKQIALIINTLPKDKYSLLDLSLELDIKKCPYKTFVSMFLSRKYGVQSGDSKIIVFPKEPIYYNLFKVFFDEYKPYTPHKDIIPASISIKPPVERQQINKWSESPKYPPRIEQYTDAELAAELRKRGFEITAKKTIEL